MMKNRIGNFFVVLICFIWISPIIWVFLTSIKPSIDINNKIPIIINFNPTLDHYHEIFSRFKFFDVCLNSLVVVGGSTFFVMILAIPASYSLARLNIKGRENLSLIILSLRFLPAIVIVLPYYIIGNYFQIIDTYLLLIIVYIGFGLPFAIFLLRSFMIDLPKDIEEAARLDGLSWLTILYKIVIPLSSPGIIVTSIFTFAFGWNEYLFSLFLTIDRVTTIPVNLQKTIDQYNVLWGELSAGATIQLLPVILIVFLLQRNIARGLTFGAVK